MTKKIYPKVNLVVLNYNGRDLLEKHLPSVVGTNYPNLNIIVVDNCSNDSSVEFIRENYSDIQVIENEKNLGFGRANNIAFRTYPECDYFVLLNNDVDVEPDWLIKLVEVAESDPKNGIVGSKILYSQKQGAVYIINSAGMILDKYFRGMDRYDGEVDEEKYTKIDEVKAVCGGAMLINAEAVKEVNGFNEKMFLYYEDVDLCLRVRDNGWKIVYNGYSVVYHDHMATARKLSDFKRTYLNNINRVRSICKRQGFISGAIELVRSPLEWLCWKIRFSGSEMTYRKYIISKYVQ